MEFIIHTGNTGKVAELKSPDFLLNGLDDFLDLMGNANYLGAERILIHKTNLKPEFFDLKTRMAGEILQKFSTYNLKLAIVGDFSNIESRSLRDFIRESNRVGRILFLKTIEEALNSFDAN
ncbi:MAG: DUF4180 domain-containing protein [Bacteroidales bacterium]|nr:DUF4180 domain-containing protein [Bacteroidales bacterium]MCF8391914.1 DUF4180 domain-containing protein [Bacteroidales bacterium]